jgi:hypothetical protein
MESVAQAFRTDVPSPPGWSPALRSALGWLARLFGRTDPVAVEPA